MKFIALRDFHNHSPEDLVVAGETKHPKHIHKGAIVEIGPTNIQGCDAENIAKLGKRDQELVALLGNYAKAIGDPNNTKLVKRIKDEVAIEEAREKRAVSVAAGSNDALVSQLVSALKGLTPAAAK